MNKALATLALLCLLLLHPSISHCQERKVYQGCSGGMLLHAGWLGGTDNTRPYNPRGATFGIGGAMRVNLWNHLRVGGEGYVSNMPIKATDARSLMQTGSYVRNGWGGFLADACWRLDKVWPYIGASIGGGAQRSLFILEGAQDDWAAENTSYFHKQTYFYVCPFVGFDIVLTHAIHLSLKLDCLLPIYHTKQSSLPTPNQSQLQTSNQSQLQTPNQSQLQTPFGPRLYFGLMFCH